MTRAGKNNLLYLLYLAEELETYGLFHLGYLKSSLN